MKAIKWFAGFFEDQGNSASSKRIIIYVCLYYMYLLINASIQGKVIDQTVLFAVVGIILFGVGAITSEFFKNFGDKTNELKNDGTIK